MVHGPVQGVLVGADPVYRHRPGFASGSGVWNGGQMYLGLREMKDLKSLDRTFMFPFVPSVLEVVLDHRWSYSVTPSLFIILSVRDGTSLPKVTRPPFFSLGVVSVIQPVGVGLSACPNPLSLHQVCAVNTNSRNGKNARCCHHSLLLPQQAISPLTSLWAGIPVVV